MYDKRFEKALGIMFQAEGGYNNLKNDYGGPTNMGITQTRSEERRVGKECS